MSQTFDIHAALAECEAEAASSPHAAALAALAAPQAAAASYADMAPLKAAVAGKPAGLLIAFLWKKLQEILATYGPLAVQWLLDYISKQIAGGTTTTPAPTQ